MSAPLKVRILLADDHAMVRHGLRMVLDAAPDLEVVAEAGDGTEAVDLALSEEIHLAVLDVMMPRRTGLQAAAELSRRRPELKLLMLSMHDSEQYLFEALKAGASGYVLKTAADRDLVEATESGLLDRPTAWLFGNEARVEHADVVTLDRVICCYPDMERLVASSSEKARRLVGAVYPREEWWVRFAVGAANVICRLRRTPFRVYVHGVVAALRP
jgi:DNA-binding response OmpR family regulator